MAFSLRDFVFSSKNECIGDFALDLKVLSMFSILSPDRAGCSLDATAGSRLAMNLAGEVGLSLDPYEVSGDYYPRPEGTRATTVASD